MSIKIYTINISSDNSKFCVVFVTDVNNFENIPLYHIFVLSLALATLEIIII